MLMKISYKARRLRANPVLDLSSLNWLCVHLISMDYDMPWLQGLSLKPCRKNCDVQAHPWMTLKLPMSLSANELVSWNIRIWGEALERWRRITCILVPKWQKVLLGLDFVPSPISHKHIHSLQKTTTPCVTSIYSFIHLGPVYFPFSISLCRFLTL